jgi:hypothetical protein
MFNYRPDRALNFQAWNLMCESEAPVTAQETSLSKDENTMPTLHLHQNDLFSLSRITQHLFSRTKANPSLLSTCSNKLTNKRGEHPDTGSFSLNLPKPQPSSYHIIFLALRSSLSHRTNPSYLIIFVAWASGLAQFLAASNNPASRRACWPAFGWRSLVPPWLWALRLVSDCNDFGVSIYLTERKKIDTTSRKSKILRNAFRRYVHRRPCKGLSFI